MSNKLFVINIVFAVVDTLIAALAIVTFACGSVHFNRWWILCFMLLPLILFNRHTVIVNADIEGQKGDENNSTE